MSRPAAPRFCAVCSRPVNGYSRDRRVFCRELCKSQYRGVRSGRDAVIVTLYYVLRKRPREIAELYGISRPTVDDALRRQ